MTCPRCQHENPPDATFCEECGARLEAVCPGCEAANRLEAKFCKQCGTTLAPGASPTRESQFASPQAYTPRYLAEKILTSRSALEGERKQVTVLFCDLADSTALAERLGPEAMHALLNRFFELALAEVHRYEGTINQFLGDGFMALFGAPVAHEDHARRAVLAAVGLQRALREQRGRPDEVELRVRMGLNTGPVVVGKIGDDLRMDYTAVGDTTHLAARVQHLAEPGTIYLSETTQELAEAYVDSAFLGEREVKGLAPQRVHRVNGLKPGATRFDAAIRRGLSPLVGRRQELATLEQAHREAQASTLRVVNLVGEAGIGKSRLLYEFRQRLAGERTFCLEGHCASFGRATPFLPFIEVVRNAFRLDERDSPAEIARKLRRGLELLGVEVEGPLPFLLNLLGLDPGTDTFRGLDGEIIGARTRDVLQELLRARCRLSPMVLALDDLHWTDSASEDLLLRIVLDAGTRPLMVVCAFRPDYRPPWAGRLEVVELVLEPLSEEGCLQLVQRRLGTDSVPDGFTRLIVDQAEGNPLFVEELTRYVVETSGLTAMEGGVMVRSDAALSSLPASLQDLVMARVDRLPEDARAVLQVASVIGRRFSGDLLRTASGADGHLPDALRALEAQELIFRQGIDGGEEYVFKHALIQEAVYASLLTTRRADLHARVAEAIERNYSNRLGEWAEVLAHHWGRTSRVDKAVRYLALAGEKSLRVYSVEDAYERFRRVVELLETVPGCADDALLADVLLGWVRAHYYRGDFAGIIPLIERYLPRVEALLNRRRLSLLLFWLGFSHSHYEGARQDIARSILERALALGEAQDDEECVGYASMGLMYVYWLKRGGRARDVVDRLGDRALAIAERRGDVYLAAKCLRALALDRLSYGRFKEARSFGQRLLDLGQRVGDPRSIAFGLSTLAWVNAYEDRCEEAIDSAEEALRISPDPLDRLDACAARGAALALMGRGQEGLEALREARAATLAAGWGTLVVGIDMPYGVAMVLAGQMARGTRRIQDSIQQITEWGAEWQPAWGNLVLGEVHLELVLGERRPPFRVIMANVLFLLRTLPFAARRARRHLESAVRDARELGMPGVAARALFDLGRLYRAKQRRQDARVYFEDAYATAVPHSVFLAERIRRALESVA